MKRLRQDGYVLAAALAALLAMSVIAAALVAATVNETRRVAAAERTAMDDAALDAAIMLAAAELGEEPRSRSLSFQGAEAVSVAGRSIRIRAGWESDKLDINAASVDAVDAALEEAGLSTADRAVVRRRLEARGDSSASLSLADDLFAGLASGDCAREVLTTFGGRSDWTEGGVRETIAIGVPAPGSRVRVTAEIEDAGRRSREAVLLMTGDPATPVRVLDVWSARGSREGCDGA